ncbi:hypothetical protein MPRG_08500 [Mycobacterium paragordonae]|uniref:PE family protein n=1 Tax=Mycobacterium paragordonae TaxID=1389713 RepID=A0ABQ1C031_9MYCO|nr:hypothetical protein MPRG_08500 [Mycobacterium paragordonae]
MSEPRSPGREGPQIVSGGSVSVAKRGRSAGGEGGVRAVACLWQNAGARRGGGGAEGQIGGGGVSVAKRGKQWAREGRGWKTRALGGGGGPGGASGGKTRALGGVAVGRGP